MASFSGQIRSAFSLLYRKVQTAQVAHHLRPISTSAIVFKEEDKGNSKDGEESEESKKKSWLTKILGSQSGGDQISHSSHLSSKEDVFEIMFHHVKPEYMEAYLKQFGEYQQMMHEKKTGAKLKGSFTVEIGEQDQAIHIWEYKGGYSVLNDATQIYRTDKAFIDYRKARNKMLNGRANQICLKFDFWPDLEPRTGPNLYELRTYSLKAGSNYEWKKNWEKGLKFRQECKPTGGFITQIGEQYQVHHIWCYKDLQTRTDTRLLSWTMPGWDDCVSRTVPLIKGLKTNILVPTPWSPLQ